jgi:hypothetical protein
MATSFGGTENRLGEVMTPKTLREGFELYKQGKPFGKPDDGPRHAMFGLVVDEVEALKESIGTQTSVADLERRIAAMELTIGNALRFTLPADKEDFEVVNDLMVSKAGSAPKRKYTRRPKNGEAANV